MKFQTSFFGILILDACDLCFAFPQQNAMMLDSFVLVVSPGLSVRMANEAEEVAELFCCGICEDLMLAPITSET